MKTVLFVLLVAAAAAPLNAGDLKLEIRDGRVTLEAKDVTVPQILAEWARVGQTRIINMERAGSAAVTIQLTAVPERQALDIILRAMSGYLAAPRPEGAVGASAYDRILILPTSVAPPARSQAAPIAAPGAAGVPFPPRVGQPIPGTPALVLPEPDEEDSEDEDVTPAANRGVVTFGAPTGLSDQPGTIAPPPSQTPRTGGPNPFVVPVGTAIPGVPTPVQSPNSQRQPGATAPANQPQPDR